jgi:hypothetical protein
LPALPELPELPEPPTPEIVTFVTPTGTANVPDVLKVCVPPGTPPPSTPIFEVPIAII